MNDDIISRAAAIDAVNNMIRRKFGTSADLGTGALLELPSATDTNVGGNLIDRQAALDALENINHVFMDLGMSCAYDMPSFWCHDRKEYKVIPTKYHKGYQKALEDVEEKIKPILEELCYG